jgi:hypothetical protein
MSTSIYQTNASQQASSSLAQMQQNYKSLFTALKTGNLQQAQTAVKNLNFSNSTLNGNAMLANIVSAIQNGDMTSAQNALSGQTNNSGGLLDAIAAEENDSSDTSTNPALQILQTSSSSVSGSTSSIAPITTLGSGLGNTTSAAAMKGVGTLFDQMA